MITGQHRQTNKHPRGKKMKKHKVVKVVPVTDFLVKIADAAQNNLRMSNVFSWHRNYLDNACRKARGFAQLELLDACTNLLCDGTPNPNDRESLCKPLPLSQHILSYYCGKGSILDYNYTTFFVASVLFEYAANRIGEDLLPVEGDVKKSILNNPLIRVYYVNPYTKK